MFRAFFGFQSIMHNFKDICDVTCQSQAFVAEMLSYDIIEKECDFSFLMIFY